MTVFLLIGILSADDILSQSRACLDNNRDFAIFLGSEDVGFLPLPASTPRIKSITIFIVQVYAVLDLSITMIATEKNGCIGKSLNRVSVIGLISQI